MRNAPPLARPARTPQRAASRRLRACPQAPGEPAPTPDRLSHELAERLPRMGRHPRAAPPATRRLRACPQAPGEPAPTPDRLSHELAERIPRMGRHHRAVAEL